MLELKAIIITSYPSFFRREIDNETEIEQRLSIFSEGRVLFNSFTNNDQDSDKVKRNIKIILRSEITKYILTLIERYFSSEYTKTEAFDTGSWKLRAIDYKDNTHEFEGVLIGNVIIDEINLSLIIRQLVPVDDLLVFGEKDEEETYEELDD